MASLNLNNTPSDQPAALPPQPADVDQSASALYRFLFQSYLGLGKRWPCRTQSQYDDISTTDGSQRVERVNLLPEEQYAFTSCERSDAATNASDEEAAALTGPPCICLRALADQEERWADELQDTARMLRYLIDTAYQEHGICCDAAEDHDGLTAWTDRALHCATKHYAYIDTSLALHQALIRTLREQHRDLALEDPPEEDSHWPEDLQHLHLEETVPNLGGETAESLSDQRLFQKSLIRLSQASKSVDQIVRKIQHLLTTYGNTHLAKDTAAIVATRSQDGDEHRHGAESEDAPSPPRDEMEM